MEDNRRQGGIQKLLVAEQEARQIVNAARSAKMSRLRQAKDEAEQEVAKYRTQAEQEFQKKVTESTGFSGSTVKRLEEETEAKIHHLKTESGRVSKDAVNMLLMQVKSVKV